MRTLLALTLMVALASTPTFSRSRDHGGHHGGHGGGPTTETPSAPSPSTPSAPNGNTNGEVGQGGGAPYGSQAYTRAAGAYNNACQTWAVDAYLWQHLWGSCR